ncbi:hypothetical protein ABZS86_34930 [Streptomyces sp. NPDC005355]|uniref:hypothetical protein n=1 Tax=Streptomyces sp. NPDC005355 TaxID=3157038 RepID=UPI0033BC0D56
MRPLLFGALLGALWAVFGLPPVPLVTVAPMLVQPVTVAFVLGLAVRPYLPPMRRWAR